MSKVYLIFSALIILMFLYVSICFSLYFHEEKYEMKLSIIEHCGQDEEYYNSYISNFSKIWESQTTGAILGSALNGRGIRGKISKISGPVNITYVFDLVQTHKNRRCIALSTRSVLTPNSFFSLPFNTVDKNNIDIAKSIYPVFKGAMTEAEKLTSVR